MKSLPSILLLVCQLFLLSSMQGQDIRLSSGNKTKTIKAGTFVEIVLPAEGTVPCEKWSYNVVRGKLIANQPDSIRMEIQEKKEVLVSDSKTLGFRVTTYTKDMLVSTTAIPKVDILSISPCGKKKLRSMSTGQVIGSVIGVLGLGHLASIPLASENAGTLAVVGASEVALAIILGVSTSFKTYVTHANCPDKPVNADRLWKWE